MPFAGRHSVFAEGLPGDDLMLCYSGGHRDPWHPPAAGNWTTVELDEPAYTYIKDLDTDTWILRGADDLSGQNDFTHCCEDLQQLANVVYGQWGGFGNAGAFGLEDGLILIAGQWDEALSASEMQSSVTT